MEGHGVEPGAREAGQQEGGAGQRLAAPAGDPHQRGECGRAARLASPGQGGEGPAAGRGRQAPGRACGSRRPPALPLPGAGGRGRAEAPHGPPAAARLAALAGGGGGASAGQRPAGPGPLGAPRPAAAAFLPSPSCTPAYLGVVFLFFPDPSASWVRFPL